MREPHSIAWNEKERGAWYEEPSRDARLLYLQGPYGYHSSICMGHPVEIKIYFTFLPIFRQGRQGLSDIQIQDSGCFQLFGLEQLKEPGDKADHL